MPKKKPSKKNDQPELLLDAASVAPAAIDDAQKAEESPATADLPAAESSPATAPANDPSPKRQPGEKVQDDEAPLAFA